MLNESITHLLRHDRHVVAAALFMITLVAWIFLLTGAGMDMSAADMTRMVYGDHSVMRPGMQMQQVWSPGYAGIMFGMWFVMMIAMMLPSAAPVILLAALINRKAEPQRRPFGDSNRFLCGYLLAWAAFSLIATGLQWALQQASLLSPMTLDLNSRMMAGIVLLAAAAWQLTPAKQACLRVCRSPAQLLVAERGRPAVLIGLRHGAYCVGCCWFLMLLLFVGGVMNLVWIVGLSLFVLAEKLLPGARLLSIGSALLLACGGVYLIFR